MAGSGTSSQATLTPNSLSGPVGFAFTDTDPTNDKMTVALTAVTDPAQGLDDFDQPDAGDRLVSAQFKIVGDVGTFSDDANSDATIIGSDNQTYQPTYDTVKGCTNFDSGSYKVLRGQTSVGCVVFEEPTGLGRPDSMGLRSQ